MEEAWRLARIPGLGIDLTGFIFKIVHCLLPTQDRIFRLGGTEGYTPGLCKLCSTEVETPEHAFFYCNHSRVTGLGLLGYVQAIVPGLTPEAALRLELDIELEEKEELTIITMLACGLKYIWEARLEKKTVYLFKMRAEVEARVSVLRC